MKRIFVLIVALILLLAACAEETATENVSNDESKAISDNNLSEGIEKNESDISDEYSWNFEDFLSDNNIEIPEQPEQPEESKPEREPEKLIIPDQFNALDISPEKAKVMYDLYPQNHAGYNFEATDEYFEMLNNKAKAFFSAMNMDVTEQDWEYNYDYYIYPQIDYESISIGYNSIEIEYRTEESELTSEMEIEELIALDQTFIEAAGLDIDNIAYYYAEEYNGVYTDYTLYTPADTIEAETFSAAHHKIHYTFYDGKLIRKSVFEYSGLTFEFDCIDYDEAYRRLLNGEFIVEPFSILNFDTKDTHLIEGCEFEYVFHCDAFGPYYHIPVYSFHIRDSGTSGFLGEFYVPAIDLSEASEFFTNQGLPAIRDILHEN